MKYIIELEDEPYMREDGVNYYTCISARWYKLGETIINRLTPYTEPDRKAIEDEVWEFLDFLFTGMSPEERYECFNKVFSHIIVSTMSYQEAKAQYEAWLKQKDEIHVGDEVLNRLGKPYVIYEIKNDSAYGIMFDEYPLNQECFSIYDTNKKTGRHFDEVEELLKKMRGEEE